MVVFLGHFFICVRCGQCDTDIRDLFYGIF